MLLIGQQRQRTCQTLSRRAFLQAGGCSVLGLSLADLLRWQAEAGTPMAGSAKSVLFLWLWGGPSHLDMWDPKPGAPLEFRGPFSPIATKVPSIRISELFPKLAQVADTFSIIRSLHTGSNDHGVAGTIGLTGSAAGGVDLGGKASSGTARPATGSVVARVRGFKPSLPPFMVVGGRLHQGKKAIIGEGGGALGALYDPFRLEYDPLQGFKIPALQLPPELTPDRLGDRQKLWQALDNLDRQVLRSIIEKYNGGPVGLNTIAASLSEEEDAIEEMYEPYLMQLGLLDRTPRGRVATALAYKYFELAAPLTQSHRASSEQAQLPLHEAGDGARDDAKSNTPAGGTPHAKGKAAESD